MMDAKRQKNLLDELPRMDDMGAKAQSARLLAIAKAMTWIQVEGKAKRLASPLPALSALSRVCREELRAEYWHRALRETPETLLLHGVVLGGKADPK
jgi:hypothetical protein